MPTALTATHLRPFDLALVALYLIGITIFGLRFRKRSSGAPADKSLKSYFLANNTIPWWAIALSIVSAETSTLTIISIPGVALTGDFGFLQVVLGYMLGRIVVAGLFLPRYFAGEMLTAYQLIDRRFGALLHKTTAGLFLLTRAAAEGVRVFAVSIVVGIAIGTRDVLSIAIISALTLIYTFEGGLAAVIWTDVVQMIIYIGGTVVAIATLGSHVPGGWSTIQTVASAAGKFHMLDFAFNLTHAYTFWAGVLGGTFLTMASHGTDQLMVQRMLAARNLRQSQLALLSSGVVIFIQFALFLLIGAGLYVFYHSTGPWALNPGPLPSSPDRIFPTFIVREMPLGIAGLLVAAILAAAMSNLSAALNSLSSSTVVDFYMTLRPQADSRERGLIAKSSTILWALVLFAIAVYSVRVGGHGHVVEIGLSIASVAYGCLLGVFLLGTLTKFATQTGATIGMVCGFALNLWLWQGTFPVHLGPLTIPHIAWTWYVLIGAAATFAIGSFFSLIFRKQSKRSLTTITTALFLAVILSAASRTCDAQSKDPEAAPPVTTARTIPTSNPTTPDFSAVSDLITTAIAEYKLPGAVVVIGHNGRIVFERAYGDRKLAGEPGLNGQPSPAEPMTEDTIFDMASLTKVLATAPAIMELYEQGKIASLDDPLQKYLPEFNVNAEGQSNPERAKVTLRMLLTHTSGEPPDVNLKTPWGLAAPDKAEGIHLALTTPLESTPGAVFRYSDINFILLGELIETLSGEPEDVYTQERIFGPLQMTHTAYHSLDHICRYSYIRIGSATMPDQNHADLDLIGANINKLCAGSLWNIETDFITAPTTHDIEGTPTTNPDSDRLLRGTVNDPTARRMGGVAGHAGVFSTAHDTALYAQALLDKLLYNTGPFPLKQSTLRLMTQPEQPATVEPATILTLGPSNPTPTLMPTPGIPLRGFGWDINTDFSRPRGAIFPTEAPSQPHSPTPSFGHTGFTGTSLWIDPNSDTYVILLANSIHPRGRHTISPLRGEVATAAAQALGLAKVAYQPKNCGGKPEGPSVTVEQAAATDLYCRTSGATDCPGLMVCADETPQLETRGIPNNSLIPTPSSPTLTGIDVLEQTHFTVLDGLHRFGLLTNQTGLDSDGRRTIDILHSHFLTTNNQQLTTLFSPEHGIFGAQDSTHLIAEIDPATGLRVTSLYGPHDADKRPTHDQLKDLDAVIIDLQDAGVRFFTYETVVGYFLEAAARERTQFHHDLAIIVLDRPNPIDGVDVQGPISDPGLESYTDFTPLPIRHGLTLGELARYDNATLHLDANLIVVPMQHWSRADYLDDTGAPWHNPSPNLKSLTAATLYPGIALLEPTNLSVGRGTAAPFENFGAGIATQNTAKSNTSLPNPCDLPAFANATGALHILRIRVLSNHPTDGTYSDEGYGQGEFDTVQLLEVLKSPIHWAPDQVFRVHPFPGERNDRHNISPEHLTVGKQYILVYPFGLEKEPASTGSDLLGLTQCGIFDDTSETRKKLLQSANLVETTLPTKEPWFNAAAVAAALNARHIPGVAFTATTIAIADDANHYPFHGQTIPAVHITLTDHNLLDSPELGLEILTVLHRLYPTQFELEKSMRLIANQATLNALNRGDNPRAIAAAWQSQLDKFRAARQTYLLYH